MMNKETRRLSKIPDEVREEIGGYFVDFPPVVEEDGEKLPKLDDQTAQHIRSGLTVSSMLCTIFLIFLLVGTYQPSYSLFSPQLTSTIYFFCAAKV